jgi:hypothetical protein
VTEVCTHSNFHTFFGILKSTGCHKMLYLPDINFPSLYKFCHCAVHLLAVCLSTTNAFILREITIHLTPVVFMKFGIILFYFTELEFS